MFEKDKKEVKSSPLSDFVRNTSSGERNKLYGHAIKNAIASQQRVIEKAKNLV